MPSVASNGIELYYEEDGNPGGDPLLLVMGLGAQLIAWPQPFVDDLVARGFRVVRPDNRDVGLSTHLHGVPGNFLGALSDPAEAPYLLSDMATDLVGLLDHLGIDTFHLTGISMGGMIAQTIAIEHAPRVRSLCSLMSTTGEFAVGQPTAEAITVLLGPPVADRQGVLDRSVVVGGIIASRTHPPDPAETRRRAGEAYDRSFDPDGSARQLAAILASGDRTDRLRRLRVPTVVIHGLQDKLIQPDGGRATAAAIPGAELIELADMGHDLPPHLWPVIAEAIEKNARRADA